MRVIYLLFIITFFATSCQNQTAKDYNKDKNSGIVLAKFGDDKITLSEFRHWMPIRHIRQKDKSKVNMAGFLDKYIKYRILLKKAKSEGYDKDPVVIKKMNEEILRRYLYDSLVKKLKNKKPSNNEILLYYRRNINKFKRPKMKRFSVLVIRCKAKTPQLCLSVKENLEKKLTKENFSKMVRKYSAEPYSRRRSGDIGFIVDPSYLLNRRTPKGIEKSVFKKVFSMKKIGSVSTAIKGKRAYYFFLLTASVREVKMPFSRLKGRIIGMMTRERKKKSEMYFYKNIYQKNKIEMNQVNINRYLKSNK